MHCNGIVGGRPDREIGSHALRGGDVVEIIPYICWYGGALSLPIGQPIAPYLLLALRAAKWVINAIQTSSMQDVLGLSS